MMQSQRACAWLINQFNLALGELPPNEVVLTESETETLLTHLLAACRKRRNAISHLLILGFICLCSAVDVLQEQLSAIFRPYLAQAMSWAAS